VGRALLVPCFSPLLPCLTPLPAISWDVPTWRLTLGGGRERPMTAVAPFQPNSAELTTLAQKLLATSPLPIKLTFTFYFHRSFCKNALRNRSPFQGLPHTPPSSLPCQIRRIQVQRIDTFTSGRGFSAVKTRWVMNHTMALEISSYGRSRLYPHMDHFRTRAPFPNNTDLIKSFMVR